MATAFVGLQVLDVWTTHALLQGGGTELNPLAAATYTDYGWIGLAVAKFALFLPLAAFWAIHQYETRCLGTKWTRTAFTASFIAGVAWFSFVVHNNLTVLQSQAGA